MAHSLADRVKETTSTTGTGSLTLTGAASGFRTFASAMTVGDTTGYCAVDGTSWEVGLGTLSASTTLARTAVHASSNAGALVNFAAAPSVFCVEPARHLNARAYIERSTTQSITSSTPTMVTWSTQTYNYVSVWSGGAATRITVPAGFTEMKLSAFITWASNSTGNRTIKFAKNGTVLWEGANVRVAAVESAMQAVYGWTDVVAGDYFEIEVTQTSGGALNLVAATSNAHVRVELR